MISIKENALNLEIYSGLRKSVNWKHLTDAQAQMAIERCLYNVVAYDDDVPVAMGRVVGDGAVICYIQDLIVAPHYQGKGVGGMVLSSLIDYVKSITLEDSEMMLSLMCAKGREEFYKKYDFIARPTETLGPGMIQYIYNK